MKASSAGFGDHSDRFPPVHAEVLDCGLDLSEAAMEDDSECRVVDNGVHGRSMAREHQARILAKGGDPGAVILVLDDPMAAARRQ